jgi:hypothetical protein
MDAHTHRVVQSIHDASGRVMIVTAGAGTQALAWLLGVAGASRTLLEALIPYDESSFDNFLGRKPTKYVTRNTAGLLAGCALNRAQTLLPNDEPKIGLSCTATIVTDRPKLGQHRAHVATWTLNQVTRYSLQLNKGARDRYGEEDLVSRLILNALAGAYGFDQPIDLPLLPGDLYNCRQFDLSGASARLNQGQIDFFSIGAGGKVTTRATPKAILSGAFSPLHDGHLGLATAAANLLGVGITFELAAVNAAKPNLSQHETLTRLGQFAGSYPVLASNAPLFGAKARLFPGSVFILGYDTAERVLQPRYYNDSQEEMLATLREIREHGCRFLVAGRTDSAGNFYPAESLAVPESFEDLFQFIPSDQFRSDISSTQLRSTRKK